MSLTPFQLNSRLSTGFAVGHGAGRFVFAGFDCSFQSFGDFV
jgi:hypothetical protein